MTSKWRLASARVIEKAIAAGNGTADVRAVIRARVDAAYPFSLRKYLPYKMWLEERRRIFVVYGIGTEKEKASIAKDKARRKPHQDRGPGQAEWDAAKSDGLITAKTTPTVPEADQDGNSVPVVTAQAETAPRP